MTLYTARSKVKQLIDNTTYLFEREKHDIACKHIIDELYCIANNVRFIAIRERCLFLIREMKLGISKKAVINRLHMLEIAINKIHDEHMGVRVDMEKEVDFFIYEKVGREVRLNENIDINIKQGDKEMKKVTVELDLSQVKEVEVKKEKPAKIVCKVDGELMEFKNEKALKKFMWTRRPETVLRYDFAGEVIVPFELETVK